MKKSAFRRIFAGVCAAVMMTAASMITAAADSTATPENQEVTSFDDGILTYTVIDDSRFVEITSCISTATNVNILPKLDGYTVTSIAEGAFAGCSDLQSVTFPMNAELTSIGSYAFAECTSLKSVKLPNTVTEIPIGMFAYCTALEEVTFGEGTTTIGDEAFRSCSALTSVDLPDTLTDIGSFVFYMCTSLEDISIPDSLTTLGGYSFSGCVNIESFHIPSTLLDLGDAPFLGCMGLTEITVDEDHPNYKVNDGVLYSKDETVIYFYPPARTDTSFTIPDGVAIIYDAAFFQCTNLQEVILPEGLETIGAGAFDFCSSLQYIKIPESVTHIMSTAFADCSSLQSVTFVGADDETDGEGESLTIEDHVFYACENLYEVILPKRTASIGEYSFGVTEIKDDSGNAIPTELDGFMLRGFSAAESYIRDCDLNVGFSPRSFPWKTMVFWVAAAAVLIVIIFFAVRIVKKNMMTPEEKEALRQAKEERKKADMMTGSEETADDGYKSILGDDDDDNDEESEEESEELRAKREAEEVNRFRSAAPSVLHHIGHDEE